jgi:hypothetical protein
MTQQCRQLVKPSLQRLLQQLLHRHQLVASLQVCSAPLPLSLLPA